MAFEKMAILLELDLRLSVTENLSQIWKLDLWPGEFLSIQLACSWQRRRTRWVSSFVLTWAMFGEDQGRLSSPFILTVVLGPACQHNLVAYEEGTLTARSQPTVAAFLGMGPKNLGFYKLSWGAGVHSSLRTTGLGVWNKLSTSNWWLVVVPGWLLFCKWKKCCHRAVLFWLEARSQLLIFASFSPQHFPISGSELRGTIHWHWLKMTIIFLNLELTIRNSS